MKIAFMGIKNNLLLLVATCLISFTGAMFYSNYNMKKLTTNIEFLGHERIPLAEDIADLRSYVHAIPRFIWMAIGSERNSKDRADFIKTADEFQKELDVNIEKYKKYSSLSDKANALVADINKQMEGIDKVIEKVVSHLNAAKDEDELAKKAMIADLRPFLMKLKNDADEVSNISKDMNEKTVEAATSEALFAQRGNWFATIIIGFFLAIFSYIFAKILTGRLSKITEAVSDASEQVTSASIQISQSAEKLASAAQTQASSIGQTSASLTEISSMSESNLSGAELTDQSAKEIQNIMEETRKSIEELLQAMGAISNSNERIIKLVKIIGEIGTKTEIIDDIVFKTQLLSFNASVEAERAGEHGRGFSVVAQEVGNLAQLSGTAATEISSIVKESIREAEMVAKENKECVSTGNDLAGITKQKMEIILVMLTGVVDGISKIIESTRQQSQGVGQITNAIETLNQTTQDTAGTAEESASASAELTGQSESLMTLVNELKMIVTGKQKLNESKKQRTYN